MGGKVEQRGGVQDGVVITYRDPSGTMIEKDIVTGTMTNDKFQEELKSVFKEITLAAGTETSEADDDPINPFDPTTQSATNPKKEEEDNASQEDNKTTYVTKDGSEIEGDLTPEQIERLINAGLIKKK